MRFTNDVLDRVTPGNTRREIPDPARPGLYFIVQPSGVKSWAVRYRIGRKSRKMTLGRFPAVRLGETREERKARLLRDPDSPSPDARELARLVLDRIAKGEDPAADKAAERKGRAGAADLVRNVWDDYSEKHLDMKRPRTAAASRRVYKVHMAQWSDKRVSEVTKRDVLDVLDDIMRAGYPSAARRARVVMGHFFGWCKGRDLLRISPCDGVAAPIAREKDDDSTAERALSDAEIRLIWKAAEATPYPFGPIVKLLILTGQRRNEIARMSDSEVNRTERLFILPKNRTKNRRRHEVHLSDAALGIINSLECVKNEAGFLFSTNGETAFSAFSKCKEALDAKMLEIARDEAVCRGDDPAKVTMKPWRLHDLRHTMISGMARIGIQIAVIEKCVNHVSGTFSGIVAVYQNYSFAPEKAAAFDAWAVEVERIVSGALLVEKTRAVV